MSSTLGKMLDAYVINHKDSIITTSSQQFGFKKGHSTSKCSMIHKETLEYYRRGYNTVYCSMLDATKAFDRVEYCKLVRLLLDRKLPAVVIRVLINMYLSHSTRVTWNGIMLCPTVLELLIYSILYAIKCFCSI